MTEQPRTSAEQAAELTAPYVAAWQAHDWAALRATLADDVTFRGPLGTADDADTCLAGLQGMARVLDRVDVHACATASTGADGVIDVITWFDLHSTVAPPAPTANWSRVRDGKIIAIRVAFDPRAVRDGLSRAGARTAPGPDVRPTP